MFFEYSKDYKKYINHNIVEIVKFEELVSSPEDIIKKICIFLDIDFQKEMLLVPILGSSTEKDSKDQLRIDSSKINKWKNGGLSNAEIYLSQKMSANILQEFGYPLKEFCFPPLFSIYYLLIFPVKLILAFVFNIHRMANIFGVIKKRFFVK